MLTYLRSWWSRSDHHDWLSSYLSMRQWTSATRAMMAFIAATMTLSLVALLASADGPHGSTAVAMTWAGVAGGAAGTVLWAATWPSRVQSLAFAFVSNASIALACLAYPQPFPSLIGCIAFATIGAYCAFFHTLALVVYNFTVATVVAGIAATRLATDGHLALAAVDMWLVIQINIALPLAIQVLVSAMRGDLLTADRDPLTGLFNRRAFHSNTVARLMGRGEDETHLLIAVIDLDNFKGLNDTWGHAVGDLVLVQVAQALGASGPDAIAARSGGEEFLVADAVSSSDPGDLAQRICDAISALPGPVTASVGTACAPLPDSPDLKLEHLINVLITSADNAMYHAKRNGGNRCHHVDLDEPTAGVAD